MAGFVQIIEFTTASIDDVQDLVQMSRAHLNNSVVRAIITADVDRPDVYVNIIEFESAEAARHSANTTEAADIAAKIAMLCDETPKVYNLDTLETWHPPGPRRRCR